jgi:hypothetical protein
MFPFSPVEQIESPIGLPLSPGEKMRSPIESPIMLPFSPLEQLTSPIESPIRFPFSPVEEIKTNDVPRIQTPIVPRGINSRATVPVVETGRTIGPIGRMPIVATQRR